MVSIWDVTQILTRKNFGVTGSLTHFWNHVVDESEREFVVSSKEQPKVGILFLITYGSTTRQDGDGFDRRPLLNAKQPYRGRGYCAPSETGVMI